MPSLSTSTLVKPAPAAERAKPGSGGRTSVNCVLMALGDSVTGWENLCSAIERRSACSPDNGDARRFRVTQLLPNNCDACIRYWSLSLAMFLALKNRLSCSSLIMPDRVWACLPMSFRLILLAWMASSNSRVLALISVKLRLKSAGRPWLR